MKWIELDNEKNVPEQGQKCIVFDEQAERVGLREWGTHYFHSIDSDGDDGMQSINITHWMPLPEPPPITQH